jgi:plastocyanin
MKKSCAAAVILSVFGLVCARAGSLMVSVTDSKGAPVANAVVYAKPPTGAAQSRRSSTAVIDQQNQQFIPYVSAVQVGTAITFPNRDNIRHHVYSFSPAKKFELPLYAGVPAEPVVFDREGFVTLGCNIHDWMLAYIAVLATPHFQVTGADGRATLTNLPAGAYQVEVWQPRMKASPANVAQKVDLTATAPHEITFTLDLKPDWRSKKAPALNSEGYR